MSNIRSAQLQLSNVSLKPAIGSHYILHDISCEIHQGDRIALVGASGSGKTSLLRLLNRLTEISQGSITVDGQDLRTIPVIQLRQKIVLVPQESKLLGMTVRQALSYPLSLRGVTEPSLQQKLATWVDALHIPNDWLDRSEVQLSVGQRQWVAIARALIIQPPILLLDEPTSALDAGRANLLMQVLIRLSDQQQTTILMANHQLEWAQQLSNRVLYIQQGSLTQNVQSTQVDWATLKQDLIQLETQEAQEWED